MKGESSPFCLPFTTPEQEQEFMIQREAMVEQQLKARNITEGKILNAFLKVPRHVFVPEAIRKQAYEDHPLPIGEAQTISQPYVVAFMTSLLGLKPTDTILEIGTGSGYQTAILAELCNTVYTVERLPALLKDAKNRLLALNYQNVCFQLGDGSQGWQEHAPFNGILVAAAGPHVPKTLLKQLHSIGGCLILPVGAYKTQDLLLVRREREHYRYFSYGKVRFVPLVGEQGWPSPF